MAKEENQEKKNEVVVIEPSEEMLENAWKDYKYRQIVGDVHALSEFPDEFFDMIICHNVLEYVDDKSAIIKALERVLNAYRDSGKDFGGLGSGKTNTARVCAEVDCVSAEI